MKIIHYFFNQTILIHNKAIYWCGYDEEKHNANHDRSAKKRLCQLY
jgi:hypothetical protein